MAAHHSGGNAVLPVRFFKIILKNNLQRLKLPNKFTRIYGDGLSNPVFLKPPYGPEWEVHWTKQNGSEIWFEKGWKEFSENYSLDHGCLVVFTYEGGSKFDVLILGDDALEVEYPSCDENENLDQNDDDDESVEFLDEWKPQKDKQKSPVLSPQPHKKDRGKKAAQRSDSLSLNRPKGARAREVAAAFISNSSNPFFTVTIKPANLAGHQLHISSGLEGYVENIDKYVKLKIGESSWDVKLCHQSTTGRKFSSGWSLFAMESELQARDVCVFELINREDTVFEVHIYKCDG